MAYLPHATHLANLPEVNDADARMPLMYQIERCEKALRRYNTAERAFQQLLERTVELLGKQHMDILRSMKNLGLTTFCQPKFAKLENLLQKTLTLTAKKLGQEHP